MGKQERKERKILTDNRMATVNKRETSFEGLIDQLECNNNKSGGEDGIYNLLLTEPNKNQIFKPKISITKHDIETIPPLKQLRETISSWEKRLKCASGRDAFTIKKALIEMRKEQYIIKQAYQKPIVLKKITRNAFDNGIKLDDTSTIYWNSNNEKDSRNGELTVSGVSLMNPVVISTILCNYSKLKKDSQIKFNEDTWYLMQAFDDIKNKALRENIYYEKLVEYKINGMQNSQIQRTLYKEIGVKHSLEYISSLWRNKIPKIIALTATEEFLIWYYKTNNLPLKKCSKCGQLKPAHNIFFSKNKTSKDKFYSICKACRNKKKGGQL